MKLYNTLTRRLEPLTPMAPPDVTMYVCGPTVYDEPHIGHARSAYTFDVLRRYLAHKSYRVKFVRNVTDVDDKIIDKARQELATSDKGQATRDLNAKCREVAQKYLARYHETMDRLGIGRPDLEPKATEHVTPEMTDLISKLLMQGAAYEAKNGDVYFAVRKFPGYGRLSNRTLDELQSGARVEPGEQKEDPLDFALWKSAKPDEPSWSSPWGKGRPGWHIECSAMSTKYLGDQFDIHGGGVDLVFPHHENEIAQAQAAGKPFARMWVHNGLLTVKGEKMSKSLGNFLTLEQIFAEYPHPDYLKLFFLKTHYRSPIDYTSSKLGEARKNWLDISRLAQHSMQGKHKVSTEVKELSLSVPNFESKFNEALDDDLNTPKALAVLFDALRFGQQGTEKATAEGFAEAHHAVWSILDCGRILGLFEQGLTDESEETIDWISKLVAERDIARREKNFTKADIIRQQVQQKGFLLTDTPSGTLWQRLLD